MRFNYSGLYLSLLMLLAAAVVGCSQPANTDTADTDSQPVAATAAVNQYCPIMQGKVSDEGGTVEWNGKTIGFCCDGCSEKWQALSDEEKAEKLAAAQAKAAGDTDHEEHQHGDHEHS